MNYEDEYKKVKKELDSIKQIQPEDNLRFLINQIDRNNIIVGEKTKVLNILNNVNLGIKNLHKKLYAKAKKINA